MSKVVYEDKSKLSAEKAAEYASQGVTVLDIKFKPKDEKPETKEAGKK